MPRIMVEDPIRYNYKIDTRNEQTLKAWFDEILPRCTWEDGRAEGGMLWPRINVHPMFSHELGCPHDPDWLTDTRAMCQFLEFRARNGEEGLRELLRLRRRLERELQDLKRQDALAGRALEPAKTANCRRKFRSCACDGYRRP